MTTDQMTPATKRTLSESEGLFFTNTWGCPDCQVYIETITEQSDDNVQTTTGTCGKCGLTFIVDRTFPGRAEFLGGHAYGKDTRA